MDEQLRTLLRQKLEVIAQDEDACLIPHVDAEWKKVTMGPECIWFVELMENVQKLCHHAIVNRGERFARTLTETLCNVRPDYEADLASELKAIVDALLPEDLYVAASEHCRGCYERHGNPRKFHPDFFQQLVTSARVGSANTTRDAKLKAHIAIYEYVLSVKKEQMPGKLTRAWEATGLRPGLFGISFDVKRFFSRKKTNSRD